MTFSGHSPRKRFGQHWLMDENVLEKIIAAAGINSGDRILEIGPGRGSLTDKLLRSEASFVYSVELDRDLVIGLKKRFSNNSRFRLIQGDVLSIDLDRSLGGTANKVVANIPYNITGPLLNKLMGGLITPPEISFDCLVLLLQKEVAERIIAKPGTTNFSAMSVRLQLLAETISVCDVPPECFKPSPKVNSQVVRLNPLNPDFMFENSVARELEKLLKLAFSGRRKKLRNTIGSIFKSNSAKEDLLEKYAISLDQRPQDISPLAWLGLARGLSISIND